MPFPSLSDLSQSWQQTTSGSQPLGPGNQRDVISPDVLMQLRGIQDNNNRLDASSVMVPGTLPAFVPKARQLYYRQNISDTPDDNAGPPPPGNIDQPAPTLMDQTRAEYPVLNNYDTQYKENYGRRSYMLEHWSPGVTESDPGVPRPKELDVNKYGVEIYDPKTRPIDIAGDIVSHRLINEDPTIKGHYEQFQSSLEPWQRQRLQEQYQYAQKNFNDERPYAEWEKDSGIPAYFRGYPFQQWPKEATDEMYTPQQLQRLDSMMGYLRGNQDKKPKLQIGRQTYGE